MAKKLLKCIYRLVEFALGFIIILTVLLFIRLSKGPIDIKDLSSFILGSSLSEDAGVKVDMKNAVLELALSQGQLMKIQIDELSVLDKEGFALTIEKADVSFNPFWLLLGRFVPRNIELEKPYVQVDLNASQPSVQTQEDKRPLCRKLNRVRRYAEQLDTLKVVQGEMAVKIQDDESILLPKFDLSLIQKENDIMDISSEGQLYFGDTSTQWKITADYNLDNKAMKINAFIDDIDLSKFHSIIPVLNGTELAFDADIKADLNLITLKQSCQGVVEDISFELKTKKEGVLQLPDPLNTIYQIQSAVIRGKVDAGFNQISLNDSQIKILDKVALVDGNVSGLSNFFNTKDLSKILISLNASLDDIPLTKVPDLWPSYLATDTHQWIKENITEGNIKKATLQLNMVGDDVDKLVSVLDVQDATVRYVDEMKPVKKANAVVTLEKDNVKIKVIDGQIDGVEATGGYVNFLDLDKDIPVFDMDVEFKGNIPAGLSIVSTKPLLVCDDMPIPCKGIKGNATGHVQLNFPFVDENLEDSIKFSVTADLEDVVLPVPKTEWDVSEGSFKLFVNNSRLTLQGRGLLDEKQMQLDITSLFDDNENSSYNIRLPVTASMIHPYFDRIDNFLKGSLFTNITIRPVKDNEMSVGLEFGLHDAEISLPIGYVKEFNKRGTIKATLSIINEELASIPSIYLSMPDEDISFKGKVTFPKDKVFELNLTEIKAPRTDANLTLSYFKNENFDVKMTGKSADISDLLHGDFFSVRQLNKNEEELSKVQDFSIVASVDTLYLSDKEPFRDVSVQIIKKDGYWQKIEGSLVGASPLTVSLSPEKTALKIKTQDVGDVLNRAGFTDRIKGGLLDSTLSQEKDGSLKGTIKVKNYKLTDTDFFMQAATLLGIVDAIRGDSISFDKAIIPFTLTPTNQVKIEDAVAFGTAVGITMSGTIESGNIDLTGSVAPAYALNSLPGKIPVVGSLLSGEEGGGLFGVSYSITGKTEDPKTSFNPASLLAPGIFRHVFDMF
ncbi:MAG: hypothetical protein J6Y03_04420 [Alphaproteobacteria bacterium]|nr:hypothetical protein [Alphaproteobacteria bacterium]